MSLLSEKLYKIVYTAGDFSKFVKGSIISEDDIFYTIQSARDDIKLRINKNSIVEIRELTAEEVRELRRR